MSYTGHHKIRMIPVKSMALFTHRMLLTVVIFLCPHYKPSLYYISGRVMIFLSIF